MVRNASLRDLRKLDKWTTKEDEKISTLLLFTLDIYSWRPLYWLSCSLAHQNCTNSILVSYKTFPCMFARVSINQYTYFQFFKQNIEEKRKRNECWPRNCTGQYICYHLINFLLCIILFWKTLFQKTSYYAVFIMTVIAGEVLNIAECAVL